jgi:DNA-binding CsgD family transcriptional regulator/DNA-binding MarR family transcriptional regulator
MIAQGIDMLPEPLSETAVQVYIHLTSHLDCSTAEVASACGLAPGAAAAALDELMSMGLLTRAEYTDDTPAGARYSASSPAVARMARLAPVERTIREKQRSLGRMRDQLESLLPHFLGETGGVGLSRGLDILPTLDDVLAVLSDFSANCREEMLTSQPGGARPATALQDSLPRTEKALKRGVRMRSIYQHSAEFDSSTISYAERVIGLGAQVRTVRGDLLRMVVHDRTTAVISLHGRPAGGVLVTDPSVVDFIVRTFEHSWASATDFPLERNPVRQASLSSEMKLAIIRLLAEGLSDKTIARRLGIAERTCQRHVAEIFEQIGAQSRFQAGYLLRDSTLLAAFIEASESVS